MRALLVFIFLVITLQQSAAAQLDTSLETQLRTVAGGYPGTIALYATDLHSGRSVAIDADCGANRIGHQRTVLFEALKAIQDGRKHWSDPLTLTKANQVEGSGVLALFDTPAKLTLKDALTLMIVLSDNTATNMAIDDLGLQNIDDRIRWMGLPNTWLYKKVFMDPVPPVPADQLKFGLGKTTAREMAMVMERFATCNLNAPDVTSPPSESDRAIVTSRSICSRRSKTAAAFRAISIS